MRKTGLILFMLLMVTVAATAQPFERNHDRIRALKIAYITEKLDLKPDQAEKFWPVYNSFEKEKWAMRRKFFEKYKNDNPAADKNTAREYIEDNLDYQEQELAIKKKYKDQLLKTISTEQLAELYKAERGFKQMLIKELGKRQGPPEGHTGDR